MFTTGSKLLFGATFLSVAGAVVFALSTGGPTGILGTVGLLSAAAVFGILAGINWYNRDGNVPGMQDGAQHTSPAAQPPVGASGWPLVAAVGVAGLVVGAVSKPVVFQVALLVLVAAVVEWMVQGWSERASADAQYNAALRKRILHPLEFPILGAIIGAAVVYAFSRIMLTIDKAATPWVFIVIGAVITFGGFLFASKRRLSKGTVVGVVGIAAIALLGAGVASAVTGQRTIEEHETQFDHPEVCLDAEVDEHVDEHASQAVSAKSGTFANIYLEDDGRLVAFVNGHDNVEFHELSVPRGTVVSVIFHNESDEPRRLTARLGTFGEDEEVLTCTTAVNPGKSAYLDLEVRRSSAASSTPLVLQVPGHDDDVIELLVP